MTIKATTLNELVVLSKTHPYYCSEGNYHSNEANMYYETLEDFLEDFEDADVDYNHIFRWDVSCSEEDGNTICAHVFIMQQRKGKFVPCSIKSCDEGSVERFVALLNKHLVVVKSLWNME